MAIVAMTIVRFEPDRAIAPPLAAVRPLLTGFGRSLAGPRNRSQMRAARMLVYTPRGIYRMLVSENGALTQVQEPDPDPQIGRWSGKRTLDDTPPPGPPNVFIAHSVSHSFRELPASIQRCNYWKLIRERCCRTVTAFGVDH